MSLQGVTLQFSSLGFRHPHCSALKDISLTALKLALDAAFTAFKNDRLPPQANVIRWVSFLRHWGTSGEPSPALTLSDFANLPEVANRSFHLTLQMD